MRSSRLRRTDLGTFEGSVGRVGGGTAEMPVELYLVDQTRSPGHATVTLGLETKRTQAKEEQTTVDLDVTDLVQLRDTLSALIDEAE